MKKIYWRPRSVSRTALVLIGVISVIGLVMVERLKVFGDRPFYQEKTIAAQMAEDAMEKIRAQRVLVGPPIDSATDIAQSGLLGLPNSVVTSVHGEISAKQTSINPNFAGAVVEMLKNAGVQRGDVVALGVSGSFPALNACTYAAIETLGLEPVVIASASASEWGANVPDLLWIDMERVLFDAGIFKTRSIAASLGGFDDNGGGLSEEGKKVVREAIKENGLRLLETPSFTESVTDRIDIYREAARGRPITCYINVGGGTVSVGTSVGKKLFSPGLNRRPPGLLGDIDGVMPRMINQGVPCIHLINIITLAELYGLPIAPASMPEVGVGDVFRGYDYDKKKVIALLALILASLYGFIRSDIGFRLLRAPAAGKKRGSGHPEPMV
ncbi:hypothetical protein Pla175_09550 [Pirellulimonas nuda]|uniref:Poly-gamma-glutamate system protein n=1 Tax=Pirellulimonas nuda TaxID=2528009 RepID=A0A518D815_9BACT|nr:poly-gamma-glutamate system protein [Pirellulimonas nuda]QDU87590.1 hypothetical protein Pla175_09550 [Pirellulimonas nuda]